MAWANRAGADSEAFFFSRTNLMSSSRWPDLSGTGLTRHDLDRGGAGGRPDHRAQVRVAAVLRPVGVVDTVVDRAVDRLEGDFLRHAGRGDPPRLLPHRGPVP